jgi:mitochondrial import inner membrane translocase subunit TIM50
MHSAILSRTATAMFSKHLVRTLSVQSGKIPPKNAVQGGSKSTARSPTSDHANTHVDARTPPSAASAQNTPVDTPNPSESDVPATPSPTTLSLDFAPPEPGTERERTGAKSSKDSLSSIERRRRQLGRVCFGLFALGLVGGGIYLGREWTEDELVSRRAVRIFFPLA